jgi:AcrR family transcriptional regulator
MAAVAQRGPYLKGQARREAILKGALNAFSELGSRKASMRAIAREVGISPALLQYYFASRDDLLLGVINEWDMSNSVGRQNISHFAGWLRSIRHNAVVPGLFHLYTTSVVEATDADHPGRPFFKQRYDQFTQLINDELQVQQDNGNVPKDADKDRIARILLAVSEGLQIRWLHEPNFDIAEDFSFLLDQFSIVIPEEERGDEDPPR